jgi:hypothetical protein
MNMKNTYELSIMDVSDVSTAEKTKTAWENRKKIYFTGLSEVWEYLGFKLKRIRAGWSGMVGNYDYTLVRIK